MKVRYRIQARADLEEIFRYLDRRSPTGARNVLQAIHAAIDNIAEFPNAAQRTSDPEIRVKIVGRYRYRIFYAIVDADYVEIIHVRHAARRSWQL
jgi:plasmid stabilization system protein ParE